KQVFCSQKVHDVVLFVLQVNIKKIITRRMYGLPNYGKSSPNDLIFSVQNNYFSAMNSDLLQTPIDYLKGVGPNRADLLRKELGIHTFQDLLHIFPNRYIDRTKYYKINELQQSN